MRGKGLRSVAASVDITHVAADQMGDAWDHHQCTGVPGCFRSSRSPRFAYEVPGAFRASRKLILSLAYEALGRDTSSYVRVEQGIQLSRPL